MYVLVSTRDACRLLAAAGTTTSHVELERLVARFLGKEEAIVFNMGYGTNATTIPALCSAVSFFLSPPRLGLRHISLVRGG